MGVYDETQSPLSPLLYTHCACFWHTALEELEPTVAIPGAEAKHTKTQTKTCVQYIALQVNKSISVHLCPCRKLFHFIQNKFKIPLDIPIKSWLINLIFLIKSKYSA